MWFLFAVIGFIFFYWLAGKIVDDDEDEIYHAN